MLRTLICLWCVHMICVRSQYTYRLLGGPAPPPAPPPAHFVSRTSRHYDTKEDLGAGPYLQKDSFFSSGFLEDLLGLSKSDPYPPPKREIQPHQSIFPSFFSAPAPPPQRPYRPPPPPPPPKYPVSYPKPSNTPRPKKFSHKPDSPYKYSVKGASTHYVEKPGSGAAVQGYPASALSRPPPHHMHRDPSPPVHSQHFNIESPFPQSAKSSHEFASPGKNGNRGPPERVSHQGHSAHKVKPFVHSQPFVDQPRSGASFFSPVAPASVPLTLHDMSPISPVVSKHQPPSMAEVIRHIDTETARHKLRTSTSTPLTSANTIKSSAFTSFQDFDVTTHTVSHMPTSTEQQEVPRKDVFQLFQKVPEQFSLVTEVAQDFQVPEIENSIESSPDARSFINEENNYQSSIEILDSSSELPNDIKVSRVSPKIRQSFDSATTSTTSHTSSSAKTLIESSTVRRRGIVSDRGRGSQNVEADNNERTTERTKGSPPKPIKKRFLLKSRSKPTKAKTVTPKKTSFSSFPYRDNSVQTSARQQGDGKKTKRKVQQRHQKLVSLEDKQENQKETLQRLLDIAGSGWSAERDSGGSRNSIVRGQQQQQQQQQQSRGRGGEFECPEPEGHFAAPGDCRAYYRCVHGAWSRIRCGPGLVWNVEGGQCDWEEEAGCDQ